MRWNQPIISYKLMFGTDILIISQEVSMLRGFCLSAVLIIKPSGCDVVALTSCRLAVLPLGIPLRLVARKRKVAVGHLGAFKFMFAAAKDIVLSTSTAWVLNNSNMRRIKFVRLGYILGCFTQLLATCNLSLSIMSALIPFLFILHYVILSSTAYVCTPLLLDVEVSAKTTNLEIEIPRSESQLIGVVQEFFSEQSNLSSNVKHGEGRRITKVYQISSRFCKPPSFRNGSVLEFAVHGYNSDPLVLFLLSYTYPTSEST